MRYPWNAVQVDFCSQNLFRQGGWRCAWDVRQAGHTKVTVCWNFFSSLRKPPNSSVASSGSQVRWRSGITAARSIARSGIIIRCAGSPIASRSTAISRFIGRKAGQWAVPHGSRRSAPFNHGAAPGEGDGILSEAFLPRRELNSSSTAEIGPARPGDSRIPRRTSRSSLPIMAIPG